MNSFTVSDYAFQIVFQTRRLLAVQVNRRIFHLFGRDLSIGAIRTDHFERGSPLAQINNYDSIKIFDRRLPPPLPNHQLCFVKLLTAVRITGHSLLVPGPPIHKQTSPLAFDSMSYRLASPGLDLMYLFYIVFLCHRAKLPRLNDVVSICHWSNAIFHSNSSTHIGFHFDIFSFDEKG